MFNKEHSEVGILDAAKRKSQTNDSIKALMKKLVIPNYSGSVVV